MTFRIQFAPQALDQLDALEDYIASAGSPLAAGRYIDALFEFLESLAQFPMRGNQRDDLFPGLRLTNFRHRTIIAFLVDANQRVVSVLGVFHGGQDYEASFR